LKNIFQKNQIVITALAIMIAVAGYLNFSGTKLTDNDTRSVVTNRAEGEFGDISEEDVLAENGAALESEMATEEEAALSDIESLDNEEVANTMGPELETPGEAVFTSVSTVGFAAEAKVTREQVRSRNKETLMEMINNANIGDELKQDAINSMIELTDIAEREAAAEMLLEAKGFTDVVVSITNDSVDVVVNMENVTDIDRAQIEDIMRRKTNVSGENIVITPYGVAE
jgi:hypothetical protein